jgi:hypothetical protein
MYEKIINKHKECIDIIDAIHCFQKRCNIYCKSLATFPELKDTYWHKIDIMLMCIKRLNERYNKALKESTLITQCKNCGCASPQLTYDGYWCKMCKTQM